MLVCLLVCFCACLNCCLFDCICVVGCLCLVTLLFVWLHYAIVCLVALVVIRLLAGTCLLTFGCWFVCLFPCVCV